MQSGRLARLLSKLLMYNLNLHLIRETPIKSSLAGHKPQVIPSLLVHDNACSRVLSRRLLKYSHQQGECPGTGRLNQAPGRPFAPFFQLCCQARNKPPLLLTPICLSPGSHTGSLGLSTYPTICKDEGFVLMQGREQFGTNLWGKAASAKLLFTV